MLPWQPFLAFYIWGAHWRHLKNTTEPSMCGGDVALCQITLTTCYCLLECGEIWQHCGSGQSKTYSRNFVNFGLGSPTPVLCGNMNYGHFGWKTLRTLDTLALVWWVRTLLSGQIGTGAEVSWRQFGPKCRTVLPQVPNCPIPSAEVSWPVFDDYSM